MTTVWMIWVQGDDSTWLEDAWDDESTAQNPQGWQEVVDKARKMAYEANYELRIQQVEVPSVHALFDIPVHVATSRKGAGG
jgi:hypothetical protein